MNEVKYVFRTQYYPVSIFNFLTDNHKTIFYGTMEKSNLKGKDENVPDL